MKELNFDDLSPELQKVTEQMAIALSGAMLRQAQEMAALISQTASDQIKQSNVTSCFMISEGLGKAMETLHPMPALPETGKSLTESLEELGSTKKEKSIK